MKNEIVFEAVSASAIQAIDAHIEKAKMAASRFKEITQAALKDGATGMIATGKDVLLHGFAFPKPHKDYVAVRMGSIPFPIYKPKNVNMAEASRPLLSIEGLPQVLQNDKKVCIPKVVKKDG